MPNSVSDESVLVYVSEISHGENTYRVGDLLYVESREENKIPHIVLIDKLWTDQAGNQGMKGCWFYRPEETFHAASRKFLDKEVFKSDRYSHLPFTRITGRCHVMSVKDYFRLKPENFDDKDIYCCESRYNVDQRIFKKIKNWRWTESHVTLVTRETPLQPKRVSSVFADELNKSEKKETFMESNDTDLEVKASDTIEGSVDKKSQLRQNEKKKRGRPPKFPAPKSPHTLTDETTKTAESSEDEIIGPSKKKKKRRSRKLAGAATSQTKTEVPKPRVTETADSSDDEIIGPGEKKKRWSQKFASAETSQSQTEVPKHKVLERDTDESVAHGEEGNDQEVSKKKKKGRPKKDLFENVALNPAAEVDAVSKEKVCLARKGEKETGKRSQKDIRVEIPLSQVEVTSHEDTYEQPPSPEIPVNTPSSSPVPPEMEMEMEEKTDLRKREKSKKECSSEITELQTEKPLEAEDSTKTSQSTFLPIKDNQKDKEVTKSPTKRTNLEPENQDNLKDKKTTVSPPKMAKLEPLNADIPDSVADELDEEELEIDQVADSDIDSDQNDGGSFMSSDKSESSRTSSPLPMPSSLHRLSSDATTTKRAAAARARDAIADLKSEDKKLHKLIEQRTKDESKTTERNSASSEKSVNTLTPATVTAKESTVIVQNLADQDPPSKLAETEDIGETSTPVRKTPRGRPKGGAKRKSKASSEEIKKDTPKRQKRESKKDTPKRQKRESKKDTPKSSSGSGQFKDDPKNESKDDLTEGPRPISPVQEVQAAVPLIVSYTAALTSFSNNLFDSDLANEWLRNFKSYNFNCPNQSCNENFVTWTLLFKHLRSCNAPGKLNKVITQKGSLPCIVCGKEMALRGGMYMSHLRTYHQLVFSYGRSLDQDEEVRCENDNCQEILKTVSDCVSHSSKCGYLKICEKCEKQYKSRAGYRVHSCKPEKTDDDKEIDPILDNVTFDTTGRRRSAKRALGAIIGKELDEDFETTDDADYEPSKEDKQVLNDDIADDEEESDSDFEEEENTTIDKELKEFSSEPVRKKKKQAYGKYLSRNTLKRILMMPDFRHIPVFSKWLIKNHSSWLFPDFLPRLDSITSLQKRPNGRQIRMMLTFEIFRRARNHVNKIKYLPRSDISPLFFVEYNTKHLHRKLSDEQQLPLFQSLPLEGSQILTWYVGGPIWAMEWCPLPGNGDQYLAISAHLDYSEVYHAVDAESSRGLIQIWKLTKAVKKSLTTPSMLLGIAHDFGPVYQMKWCPSGATEPKDTAISDDHSLRRLGLLAAACGDGKVRIFSIPFPENLPSMLKDSFIADQPERSFGTICAWNLKTTSSLLTETSPDGEKHILPFCRFLAHGYAVKTLCWCPDNENLIMTGSNDKSVKVFDLRTPQVPLLTYRRGVFEDVKWPVFKSGLYCVEEESFNTYPTGCRFLQTGESTKRIYPQLVYDMITTHASGSRSVDFSTWLDTVATCCNAGEVIIKTHQDKIGGRVKIWKLPIYDIQCNPLPEDARESVKKPQFTQNSASVKRTVDTTENSKPGVFNAIHVLKESAGEFQKTMYSNKYTFRDTNFWEFRPEPGCCVDELERIRSHLTQARTKTCEMETRSINRVRWNPNYGCHQWLASGGILGLVRLHPLHSWTYSYEDKT